MINHKRDWCRETMCYVGDVWSQKRYMWCFITEIVPRKKWCDELCTWVSRKEGADREGSQGESPQQGLQHLCQLLLHVVHQDDLTERMMGQQKVKSRKTFIKSDEENAAISEHSSSPTIFYIDQPSKQMINILWLNMLLWGPLNWNVVQLNSLVISLIRPHTSWKDLLSAVWGNGSVGR